MLQIQTIPHFFLRKVFDILPDDNTTNTVIAGDFNCCLDPVMDRSLVKAPAIINSIQTSNSPIKSKNMVDIWRILLLSVWCLVFSLCLCLVFPGPCVLVKYPYREKAGILSICHIW